MGQVAVRLLDERLAPSGLLADEFGFYGLLGCAGPLTPTEITRWTGMRPSTITSFVKRLEARGHVRRRPNETDRRSYRLELTEAGIEAWQRACAAYAPLLA